jgi:hypothetical protein
VSGSVRVAVIGSGPSGLYTADELSKHSAVSVDVLDRLPCPYGLLRYGVAPDHLKMKSLEITLRKILERPGVRFLGGVELGSGITVEDVRECYDAVVYATGSSVDRRLSIPGEDLPGSFSATEFVAWYCGHPDAEVDAFTLDARSAVVVGVGNVAVDVARRISTSPTCLITCSTCSMQAPSETSISWAGADRRRPSSPPRSCASWANWLALMSWSTPLSWCSIRPARNWPRRTRPYGATWTPCRSGPPGRNAVEPGGFTCGSCSPRWQCSAPARSKQCSVSATRWMDPAT